MIRSQPGLQRPSRTCPRPHLESSRRDQSPRPLVAAFVVTSSIVGALWHMFHRPCVRSRTGQESFEVSSQESQSPTCDFIRPTIWSKLVKWSLLQASVILGQSPSTSQRSRKGYLRTSYRRVATAVVDFAQLLNAEGHGAAGASLRACVSAPRTQPRVISPQNCHVLNSLQSIELSNRACHTGTDLRAKTLGHRVDPFLTNQSPHFDRSSI